MKSHVGLKDVVIAPVMTDTSEGTSYGEVQPVAGAIDMSITPSNADPDVQYADDIEYDVVNPDPEIAVAMEFTQLPLKIQADLEGHKLDDNGVLVQTAGDTPAYYAIGGKSELRDGGYRYVWLLKCRAKPITETYHTKEGQTITRQTGKIEFTAIKRASDNRYQFKADEGQNGFTKEKAATFLSGVYEPVFANQET